MVAARVDLPTKALQAAVLGSALVVGLLAGLDPPLAVVAALAIGFVVLALSDLTVGLALFAVLTFVDVLPAGGLAPSLAKVAGLLLALSWVATIATRPSEANFLTAHPAFSYLLLVFVGWSGVSALWAEASADALDGTYRLGLNVLLFMIVFTALREQRHVLWLIGGFLAGAVVSAAYGVAAPAGGGDDISRLSGVGLDPNELASLLVASLVLAAAFATAPRMPSGVRTLAALASPLLLLGIVFSFSRGGLVALGVALLASVAASGRRRIPAIAVATVIGLAGFSYLAFVAQPEERSRVTRVDGGTGRTDIWTVGWRMVEANPIRGVGAGNFDVASVHYLLEPGAIARDDFIVDTPKAAHNMYLDVLAELGVVGLLPFLAIIAFSLTSAMHAAHEFARRGDARLELLSRAVFVSLLALLAADFFLSEQYSKQLWLLLALGPSLRALASRPI